MFIDYSIKNIQGLLGLWLVLTLINQIVFFGSCLRPDCILASIPHVSIITLIIFYNSYKVKNETYDEVTGYNEFGYDKNGYNCNGYNREGYDKHGYNKKGIDINGVDRLGRGSIRRFFSSAEKDKELQRLNREAIEAQSKTVKTNRLDKFAIRNAECVAAEVEMKEAGTEAPLGFREGKTKAYLATKEALAPTNAALDRTLAEYKARLAKLNS